MDAIEKQSGREIQATKFICEFNPKAQQNIDLHANICFLAKTNNDLSIAVVANTEGENAEEALIMCLNSSKLLNCRKAKEGSKLAGCFSFDELDLICETKENSLTIEAKLKNKNEATSDALVEIFQTKSLQSLPSLLTY